MANSCVSLIQGKIRSVNFTKPLMKPCTRNHAPYVPLIEYNHFNSKSSDRVTVVFLYCGEGADEILLSTKARAPPLARLNLQGWCDLHPPFSQGRNLGQVAIVLIASSLLGRHQNRQYYEPLTPCRIVIPRW